MMVNYKIILLVFLIFTACKETNKTSKTIKKKLMKKNKFEWKPTECAPYHYAAEIYHGDMITEKDKYYTIPYGGTINNGWGTTGTYWAVGDDFKTIPSRLKIIWLSYTEDQFYFLDTELPKQKIVELFEKGYVNKKGKQDTYDEILVGLAPGGAVSVWLFSAEFTVEAGHYQAKKTDVPMSEFNPDGIQDRNKYVKEVQEGFSEETKKVIAEQGIPIGKWTAYRERFLWKPIIKHVDVLKLATIYNNFYNGEHYAIVANNPILQEYHKYPPSEKITFYWYDKNNNKFGCKIKFEEKEIWSAFKTMYKKEEVEQAELVFAIDKYNSNVKITLESAQDTIEIKKAEIKTFTTSD